MATCAFLGRACLHAIPAVVVSVSIALAQAPQQVDIYTAITHDVSRPLPEMARSVVTIPGPAQSVFLGRIPFNGSEPARADGALQTQPLPTVSTTPGVGVEGLGNGVYGFTVRYAPPDTNGAVGQTQYVQWVNTSFAVFNKSDGTLAAGPFPGNALWQGFGGGCQNNNDGDPIVQYDKLAHRWIFTQFSVSNKPYLQCFAVSTTENPLGPYIRFAFSFGNTSFPDYPKLGVWPDGWYLSFNIFRNGFFFSGPRACAVDRNTALSGGTPTMLCYQLSSSTGSLLPSDLDGLTPPPAGSPNYFVAFGNNSLQVWKFRPNFVTPSASSLSGPTNLSVAAFTPACNGGTCIPQPVTSQKLDSLGDRLMYRAAYRNRAGVGESLLLNHSVQTSSAASGVRWYELRIANTNPTVFQQGTFSPADGVSRWMGSIAMDKCGNIALGYSVSSPGVYPGIRYTGRVPGDTLGQLEAETTVVDGTGYQGVNLNRWGDYSAMNVDPVDDTTFWYTTEYMKTSGTFNWNTRIASFKIGSCP